jgi:putative PIN family toxin of toxin-antitoxin system
MIKIVLDTNSVVSGLLDFGAPRGIIILAYRRRIQLCVSSATLEEFTRVIRYQRLTRRIISKYLTIAALEHEYARLSLTFDTSCIREHPSIPADPDDEEFIRVALAADASLLITRDNHLLDLNSSASIQILRPSRFMECWRNNLNQNTPNQFASEQSRWHVWRKRSH